MIVELDDDMLDKLFADSLLNTYRSVSNNTSGIAIFSFDKEEESKKIKKLLRSIERVHDWYSAKPLQERLKQEQALEEFTAVSQELKLE
jgi:hypothetical protein